MNRCGCNPTWEKYEFKIPENLLRNKYNLPELFPITPDLDELKRKIICEYSGIINKLECGFQEDLEFLLEEISLVDIMENG